MVVFFSLTSCSLSPDSEVRRTGHRGIDEVMANRGGATRPNGANAGNKICQFKLVLLGESAVGKSSLVLRFVKGQFHEFQESTIGGEFPAGFPWHLEETLSSQQPLRTKLVLWELGLGDMV